MSKFEKGDIITDGNATFRVNKIGRNFLGYYYILVNIDIEKKGLRYLKDSDGSKFGETLCLCEQVDKKFHMVVDKVEPKFRKGDWITNGQHTVQISEIDNTIDGYYRCINGNHGFGTFVIEITKADKTFHLWSIEDAKNGDVLATEDKNFTLSFIAIYKSLSETYDGVTFNSHCFIGFNGIFYKGEEGHSVEDIRPATKEQRYLLFQKMKEAGYAWNVQNKELSQVKDIVNKQEFMTPEEKAKAYDNVREKIALRFGTNVAEEMFSEFEDSEDERIRKALISILKSDFEEDTTIFDISVGEIIAWLENQRTLNKVSIWKHWKDGIAGNGDGIPVFLIKNGLTYSLSPCLSFECDYIELSELDNLMLEKGEQKCINYTDKEWYDFIRWFVNERTNHHTLIPDDDDIQKWGNMILSHAIKVLVKQSKVNSYNKIVL